MAKLSQAQEPSMEEILASIRRIISEDDADLIAPPPRAPAASVPPPIQAPPPNLSTDAIDALFASKPPEPKTAAPQPGRTEPRPAPPSQAAAPQPAPPLRSAPVPPPRAEPTRQSAPPRQDARPLAAQTAVRTDELAASARSLLSPGADAAVNAAFGNLAGAVLASGSNRTIEDLVKEMLRPMLKAWLDTNLPPLVERLVRDEIERVSRGR